MSYTPRILTEDDDLNGIRFAAQMTEFNLPDSDILSPVLLPAVESEISKCYPGWDGLTGDELRLLRSAVTNLVAVRALSRKMERESGMEYSYTRKRAELIEELKNQAAHDLSRIDAFDEVINKKIVEEIFTVYGRERYLRATGDWMPGSEILS